jgi:hypothetical protein
MDRTYKAGRPTTGWTKGKKVTDIVKLIPGTVLIDVSHQFKAENLIVIVRPNKGFTKRDDIVYYKWMTPKGKRYNINGDTAALWDWELTGQNEYFLAEKEKVTA